MDNQPLISIQDWPSPMDGQRIAAEQEMAMARAPLGRSPDPAAHARSDVPRGIGACGGRTGLGARSRPGRRW
jgi:hypothetical protein